MSRSLTAVALTAALTLGACATPTPYQPLTKSNSVSGGYSDLKISGDRYRITFQGNDVTDRDTVERYLLFHAAEVTLRDGYDYFLLTNRNTDKNSHTFISPDPAFGGWQPQWYYARRGRFGPGPYSPFGGPGFGGFGAFGSYDATEITRYKANAEILMVRGRKPAEDPAAFDARDVAAHLAPTIAKPAPKA
jgi:hypothetical protein